MKSLKKVSQNIKLTAVFVAGLAVATFGWWQSDRLDLAYGASAGVNQVIEGAGSWDKKTERPGSGSWQPNVSNCSPQDNPRETWRMENCNVVKTVENCTPKQIHVLPQKTRQGTRLTYAPTPIKNRTIDQVVYNPVKTDQVKELKAVVEDVKKEVEDARRTVSSDKVAPPTPSIVADHDAKLQEHLRHLEEVQKLAHTNPKCMQAR